MTERMQDRLDRAICEALYGEGSYPWNEATGMTIRWETANIRNRILDAIPEIALHDRPLEVVDVCDCCYGPYTPRKAHVVGEASE